MDTNLLAQGATLMLVGMGTVFVFLTSLVAAMTVMSKLLGPRDAADAAAGAPDADELAAITAAVEHYRRRHLSRRGP